MLARRAEARRRDAHRPRAPRRPRRPASSPARRSLDAPVRWVHISELADPTPWLSGGELLLTTGHGARRRAERQRDVRRARWPTTASRALGFGTGFAHDDGARRRSSRPRASATSRCSRSPTSCRSSPSPSRRSRGWSTSSTRCCSARSPPRSACSASSSPSAASTRSSARSPTLVGGTALVFDGRGEPQAQRTFRRELDDDAVAALGAELRERARRGDGASFVPGHPDLAPRASRCRSARATRRTAAACRRRGSSRQGRRRPGRDRPPDPAPGRHRRRARAAAPPRRRLDRAPPGRRRAQRASCAGELAGRELAPPARAVRARRPRDARSCSRRASAGAPGLRGGAGRGAARRGGQRRSSPATGPLRLRAAARLPDDELFELAERVVARAGDALGAAPAAGAGRAVAGRPRARGLPRGALRARGARARRARAGRRRRQRRRRADGGGGRRDLPRPRLLPAAALACRTPTRCGCSASRCSARSRRGEGHYGGELMRSLEAFIECNGQWEARRAAALLPPPHAALPDPQDRGAHRAATSAPPATASSSGSPCAAARSSDDPDDSEAPVKVGVPTEIKTDEYRVALTPSGVRELDRPRPRGGRPGGRGRGLGDRRRRLRRAGRADRCPTPTRSSPRPS